MIHILKEVEFSEKDVSYQNKCKHCYTGATDRSPIRWGDNNTQNLLSFTTVMLLPSLP